MGIIFTVRSKVKDRPGIIEGVVLCSRALVCVWGGENGI